MNWLDLLQNDRVKVIIIGLDMNVAVELTLASLLSLVLLYSRKKGQTTTLTIKEFASHPLLFLTKPHLRNVLLGCFVKW